MIQRSFVNVFSDRLAETRDWYVALLGWQVAYDSDWYVQLQTAPSGAVAGFEFGILRRDHDIVPPSDRLAPGGTMLTVVVDDADAAHRRAVELGVEVVEAPRDLFYGQRRLLVRDPNGFLVDVSSECAPSPEFLASMG